MNATRNDLPEETRQAMVTLLNYRLADALDLYLQTKQAHWNVKGPSFIALHELFDSVAEHVEAQSDTLAERAVALGGVAEGTLQAVSERSTLAAYDRALVSGMGHVRALSDALAAYGKAIRAAIAAADEVGDADTADLFTEVSREVDKDLWFVEAHLGEA
jgi:starvation-inducible DNA-binding protein